MKSSALETGHKLDKQDIAPAVVVFMVGLVSEQVAQLRYDRSEDRD